MRKIKVQPLNAESFKRYGSYAALINPKTDATGPKDAEIVFYRDMVQQNMWNEDPSYSTCRMLPRPLVVTDAEYHNSTCEVSIPLDGDAIIWFAPATAGNDFPSDQVEAFYVPQGTVISIRPGVWHHAAYATGKKPLNVLIVLPERAYVRDVVCIHLDKKQQVKIESK